MALRPAPSSVLQPSAARSRRRARRRGRWGLAALVVVAVPLALAAAAWAWSGAKLVSDPVALARVEVEPFGGTLEAVRARAPAGRAIPLSVDGGRLTPRAKLTPGQRVTVEVVVRRPRWLGWALGRTRHEELTVRAPVARVSERWLTLRPGSRVRVSFDRPVSTVAVGTRGRLTRRLHGPRSSIVLPRRSAAGSLEVAVAARPWERLGKAVAVSWFPPHRLPVVVSSPAPSTRLVPLDTLRLTFSRPVADVLGSALPKLSPKPPGRWWRPDDHTLVFAPSGFGTGLDADLHVAFPRKVAVADRSHGVRATRGIAWTASPGSVVRLQQLLAEAGYLPLDWKPSGPPVERTPRAELRAALDPPAGDFDWRYSSTPPELRSLWRAGEPNQITRGAVMMFQDDHELAVDGFAGPDVWRALLADAVAGKRRSDGYSYVYVHRAVPQSLNLWHNGHVILSSPGNTGVPAAPTQLGTFPVFEHIAVGTMSGTNPDGSHYNDPGIRYISYFNHGDAIHAFTRASFGTPQSLGCVELPLAAAAKVWPYTPIGTLVTVED